jgi:RNA polymerase primary sigma factor
VKTPTNKVMKDMEALAPYLRGARAHAPLAREEERDLASRARRGDTAARDRLVRANLALVVMVARKQIRGALPLEELVQEGNLGLLRAVEKFDPNAGTRFSTYAFWWIRAYIWRYLKQARSSVRPKSGTAAASDLSLDRAVGDEGDASYLDRIEDERPLAEEAYAASQGDRQLREALERIRKRVGELGWDIIQNRLQKDPPDTLEQIGNRRGVSRERVRQVELATKRFLVGYLEPRREAATDRKAA